MSVFLQIPLMQLFLPNKRKKNITIRHLFLKQRKSKVASELGENIQEVTRNAIFYKNLRKR